METNNRQDTEMIDLSEIFSILWKRKYYIMAFVILCSLLSVIYALNKDNIYESAAVLKPTDNSKTDMLSNLSGLSSLVGISGLGSSGEVSIFAEMSVLSKNKEFLGGFIKRNKLTDALLPKPEMKDSKDFKEHKDFILANILSKNIMISEDTKTKFITFAYRDKDPAFAQRVVKALLNDISDVLKTNQLENIDQKIENYKDEMDGIADITLKNKLSEYVATLIQSRVMANADEYYGFTLVIEPAVPDKLDKVGPKRALICMASFIGSLFLSIIGVFLFEYIQIIRKQPKTV
jgi:uncharacterized protein involved in exopolysaccharide biosynthesis